MKGINYYFQFILRRFKNKEKWKDFVARHHLENELLDKMIDRQEDEALIGYVESHQLQSLEKEKILGFAGKKVVQALLRATDELTEKEQLILIERGNPELIESYLAPKGYSGKRFSNLAEDAYIAYMIQNPNVGLELFKIYITTHRSSIRLKNILLLLIEKKTYTAQYVLKHCNLRSEDELCFVTNADDSLLEEYLKRRSIYDAEAQIALLNRNFRLAEKYCKLHNSSMKVRAVYSEIRKQRQEKRQTKGFTQGKMQLLI